MRKVAVEIKSAETQAIAVSYGTIADIECNRLMRICNKFKVSVESISSHVTAQSVECTFTLKVKNYKKNPDAINILYNNLMSGFEENNHVNEVENYVQYLGKKKLKKFNYEIRFTPLKDETIRVTITRI